MRTEAAGSSGVLAPGTSILCIALYHLGLHFFATSRALLATELGSNVGPSWHGDAGPFQKEIWWLSLHIICNFVVFPRWGLVTSFISDDFEYLHPPEVCCI